jgi:CysZ protein
MEQSKTYPAIQQKPDFATDFFQGITSYGRAWGIIRRHKLWYYVFVPGIISLILGSSIAYSAYLLTGSVSSLLVDWYPEHWWGVNLVSKVATIFSWLILGASGFLTYRVLLMAFVAPFMSPLAAKIQEISTGKPVYDPSFFSFTNFRLILRGGFLSLRNVLKEVWYTLWLLLLGLVPFFNLATPFLIFSVQAFFTGFGNLDYTLEKYYGIAGSKKFVGQYRGLAIGNGTMFLALLAVPVLGLFFAPALSTAAATLETVRRIDAPVKTVKQLEADFI